MNDLGGRINYVSDESCAQACESNPSCKGFVVGNAPTNRYCWLKSSNELSFDPGFTSFVKGTTPSTANTVPQRFSWTNYANNGFMLKNKTSSNCVSVRKDNFGDGSKLIYDECNSNSPYQQFTYNERTQRITNPITGRCIDMLGGKRDDGSEIGIWGCQDNNSNMKWSYDNTTGLLKNNASGTCMTQGDNSIVGWSCFFNEGKMSAYDLVPSEHQSNIVPDGDFYIQNRTSKTCVVHAETDKTGTNKRAQGWFCAHPNHVWNYLNDTKQLKLKKTGLCLDNGGNRSDGSAIYANTCDASNNNQKWQYDSKRNQWVGLSTGQCIDLSGTSSRDGTDVNSFSCTNNNGTSAIFDNYKA